MSEEIPVVDEVGESQNVIAAQLRYKDFLDSNPESKIAEYGGDGRLTILKPWGDASLAFVIPQNDDALCEALNNLYLPPRYTALYHSDLAALEVIWTAYKLDESQSEIVNRKFNIALPIGSVDCEFVESSERLLEIARCALPLEISHTGFRNLQSFGQYTRSKDIDDPARLRGLDVPRSFWIKGIDWNEERVLEIVRHINFCIRYYDAHSPTVQIHPVSKNQKTPRNRYLEGFGFPEKISLPTLDANLMVLNESGYGIDSTSTSFLNLFRVVEYVAFDYTQHEARQAIQAIISAPHTLHNTERTAIELMHVLKSIKAQKDQDVIPHFLRENILPKRLWKEIELNKEFFASDMSFDGGLVIKPIITAAETAKTFGSSSVEHFGRQCVKIRNCLAHGRDKVTSDSILPTSKNLGMLKPWINALAVCSGDVVIYAAHH